MKPARILTIAGSDSSGGAGIQADIKTITMLGGFAMSAITAVTAQNTLGVTMVEVLSPDIVAAQIDACISDIGVDAVKIGMLGSAEIAHAVADRLEGLAAPMVFDPVMIATSGAELADAATIAAFERLMALATVVTPNLPELAILSGITGVTNEIAMSDAAATIMIRTGVRAVLAKGGHDVGGIIRDWLFEGLPESDWREGYWEDTRIDTVHTHGTGCTLASAIATGLGQGLDLADAISQARGFVRASLMSAPGFGQGHGPMGHQAVRS